MNTENQKNLIMSEQTTSIINVPDSGSYLVVIAGGYTLIDAEDLDLVLQYRWFADRDGYATTFIKEPTFHSLRLHHLIRPREDGLTVDHRNHIRLDNRRCNLNLLPMRENIRKRLPDTNNILYTQDELLQRGTNYNVFKAVKQDLKRYLEARADM